MNEGAVVNIRQVIYHTGGSIASLQINKLSIRDKENNNGDMTLQVGGFLPTPSHGNVRANNEPLSREYAM